MLLLWAPRRRSAHAARKVSCYWAVTCPEWVCPLYPLLPASSEVLSARKFCRVEQGQVEVFSPHNPRGLDVCHRIATL